MDFTLVLLSGGTWFKLSLLMLSLGMLSHVQIGVCCPVSATRIIGPIYFLIQRIHAYINTIHRFLNTCSIAIQPVPTACNRLLFSFVKSVCLSVRPHGITQLPMDGFLRTFMLEDFSKIRRENSSFVKSVKSDENKG